MKEKLTWEEIYAAWKYESYRFSNEPSSPTTATEVFVDYRHEGYFYGYDWRNNASAKNIKDLIESDPISFLLFSSPTNKGTIHTAQMLAEAKDDEEHAAIWIAATAKDLYEFKINKSVSRQASRIFFAALAFLNERFFTWHHAMRSLVPEIMIPNSILNSIDCEDIKPVVALILMNTELLKNTHEILLYSSLKEGQRPETSSLRK